LLYSNGLVALALERRYGPAAFKVDWALGGPIPWRGIFTHSIPSVKVVEPKETAPDRGAASSTWGGEVGSHLSAGLAPTFSSSFAV